MDACDVLIVGGGPAGSSCAWRLARAGVDVLVLDRAVFPRDKVCAGWITPPVVELLELDLGEYGAERTLQPITGFRTALMGGRAVEARYPTAVSYGIRRCEFDHYLLARSGARLRAGEALRSLRRAGDGWMANDAIRARVVVGAGGHFCPVARALNPALRGESVVAAQELEFRLAPEQRAACRIDGATPELFFCRDLQGYGWCFRKGDHLNVGLGTFDRQAASAHTRAFIERLQAEGRIPRDLPRGPAGHAYLVFERATRVRVGEAALLVGDAAGLAYSESGEGIRPAIESGILAAEAILEAGGRYGREQLAVYAARLEARFGRPAWARVLSRALPAAATRAAGRHLLAVPWFVRRVVLDRWFLRRAGASADLA